MAGRTRNEGEGKTFSVTVPAGLYEYLTRHARRAIIGKNQGEVAVYLITQQALSYERDGFLGVEFPRVPEDRT